MKKFNDMFSKRQDHERQYQEIKPKRVFFNQSYFNCQLIYQPHKLSLIKVQANISVGPEAGTPLLTHCRWFVKTNNKYKQIPDVKSTCYQPCIDDVGCQICVQIDPSIEGKSYSGATITKQTMPMELGPAIESTFTQIKNKLYHFNEAKEFNLKIQKIKSEVGLSFPFEGKAIIKRRNQNEEVFIFHLEGGSFNRSYIITKEYPAVEFVRNSFNTTVLKCIKDEQIRVTFETTTDRDIFGLLVRTLSATSIDIPLQAVNDEGEDYIKEEEEQQETSTTLVENEGQKLEDMGRISEEVIQLKKEKKEIIKKYNFEKQTRIKLQALVENYNKDKAELELLRRQLSTIKEQNEQFCSDNRFYINELTILKKQIKETTKTKEELEKQVEEAHKQERIFRSTKLKEKEIISPQRLRSLEDKLEVEKAIKEEVILKNQTLKEKQQELENELKMTKNKIESLVKEKIKKQKVEEKEPQIRAFDNKEEIKEKEAIIQNLRFKIGNLQNLLKYKMSEPGGENLTFQKIISNLTETVTEKEEELRELRKVNKELLQLLKKK